MIESPCISECCLKDGVRRGCSRTKKEIKNWLKYDDDQKQKVLNRLNELHSISSNDTRLH